MSRPSYFLSDLHLRALDDPRTAAVLRFLRARVGEARAVYLLGDVFDLGLGYRASLFQAHFPLLRALAELVEAGTRVVLFTGNHDPDPGPLPAALGVEVHEGPLEEHIEGYRVRLEHGDTIDPRGWSRRLVCKAARHRLIRRAARGLHPELAWRLGRWYGGDAPAEYQAPLPEALLTDYLPRQARAGVDVLVLGHYHRAVHHRARLADREVACFVLGDWVAQRTFLKAEAGAFSLWRDQGQGRPPALLPQGDHGPEPPR